MSTEQTLRDTAITDLEEISDLLSEIGTSVAEQDMETAETQWNEAQMLITNLQLNMRELFKD